MAGLMEVPTEELLLFQDYPTIHTSSTVTGGQLAVDILPEKNTTTFNNFEDKSTEDTIFSNHSDNASPTKSFWTIEYYQQFFDVDTKDVIDRLLCSFFPRKDLTYKIQMKSKPDLYGPFWIAITLVFTIAISGNVAKYLQYANAQIHWKYDFHLVSYAATAIFLYITVIPFALWTLLKWGIRTNIDDDDDDSKPPRILELICFYGYSLFIYIPVSILWTIQVNFLQWILVAVAACLSGSVLILALNSSIKISNHKVLLTIVIISFHLLLAAGFMLYFFHVPNTIIETPDLTQVAQLKNKTI